jgi:sugar phosphate isomerase/epimerase
MDAPRNSPSTERLDRRTLLKAAAAGWMGLAGASFAQARDVSPVARLAFQPKPPEGARPQPTRFLVACTTLPYSKFPLVRALQGIAGAGFQYVAWGITHVDNGAGEIPLLAEDADVTKAKELGQLCRDMKLTPVMLQSLVAPEQKDAIKLLTHRILQAQAAGIGQVLTYGQTRGGNRPVWIERLKHLGPIAKDHNVTLVIRPNGGETGSGKACGEIVREVDHPHVMMNYSAGSVLDALNIDPIPDLKTCAASVRSLSIKDHRKTPRNEDCGPGLGEIDHYKLLAHVSHTGQEIPLCCENLFAPLVPRPTKAEEIDALARRAREFLELVIAGLHAPASEAT